MTKNIWNKKNNISLIITIIILVSIIITLFINEKVNDMFVFSKIDEMKTQQLSEEDTNINTYATEGRIFTKDDCPYDIAFTQVSMGDYHSLAIDEEGNLWAWGNNSYGQLGNGTKIDSNVPIQIAKDKKFIQVSTGNNYSLAIDIDGNLWAWGDNEYYKLGTVGQTEFDEPIKIKEGIKFKKIAAGDGHTLALAENGNLYGAGNNSDGQLGIGLASVNKAALTFIKSKIGEIAVGNNHSLAIDEKGNLWAWGNNTSGRLGDGTEIKSYEPKQIANNKKFSQVSAGYDYSLAIDMEGNLWTWGDNFNGSLGLGKEIKEELEPTQLMEGKKFNQISSNGYSSAIDNQRNVWVWGPSIYGLGIEGKTISYTPITINREPKFIQMSLGSYASFAIDEKGDLWAWGRNYEGQFGNGTTTNSTAPVQITKRKQNYNVILNTNGGTINEGNITEYTVGIETTLPTNVTKQGYKFAGWYDNQNLIGNSVISIGTTERGDKTYYAKWTANTNTPYKVEYYKQNTKLNGYDLIKTENKTGTTGENISIGIIQVGIASLYEGFELNESSSVKSGVITADGSLVLKLYFDRETYDVTLDPDGGIIPEGKDITSYVHGIEQVLPEPTKQGYTFNGWDNVTSPVDHEENVTTVGNGIGNKIFKAKWTPRNDISYTQEWYYQNETLDGYELKETETLIGTTGEKVVANLRTVMGLTGWTLNLEHPNSVYEGIVAGDGSLVLKVYYDRDVYRVNLNLNGGTLLGENITSYTYGLEEITLPTATKEGYEFLGWWYVPYAAVPIEPIPPIKIEKISKSMIGNIDAEARWEKSEFTVTFKDGNERTEVQTINKGESATAPNWTKPGYTLSWDKEFTNVTNDLVINAIWTANTNTPYKVVHHFRNLDTEVEGYNEEEEVLAGTTDTIAVGEYKEVEGFTKNETDIRTVKQGTIAGDGSLVLHLYYTRNSYNITYELNGGTANGTLTSSYIYGKEMTLQNNRVTKQGYEFAGWYDNESLEGSVVTSIPATSIGNKTFYAKWTKNVFTVTFKDGTERTEVQTINKGESATAPNWTKPGYTLTWDVSFENVTSDLTVNAQWEARTDTPYKVIHHFRNLDTEVQGFIDEEETKTGTTGETVTAEYKTVEGFTKNEEDSRTVKQGTVAGDGSLVLHLYYTRNTYNISYELNGGTLTSPLTNKYVYGKEMILQTNRVTKEGYAFAGWYDNEELTGSPVTSISATATGDKTFYAKWVDVEQEYYILSEVYNIDLAENTITKVSPETNVANFLSKIDTNGEKKLVNAQGQEVTTTSLVGTGYKLQVTFKGETYTYEIAVRGDIDGNGKVTTTDLSIINQQILHKIELTGIKAKAADTDYNGRLTTTDLSMINQAVLRKITL